MVSPVSSKTLAKWVYFLIYTFSSNRPPKDSLIFLLELERLLFSFTGVESCRYGQGIHSKHRHTKYHDFFVQRIQSGDKVLDIGCGNGALSYDMAQAGGLVVGIDFDSKSIFFGCQHFSHPNLKLIQGDALKVLPENEYDIIVMSNVLEHIENRIQFIKKFLEKYKPKRWLFRVPLYDRDWRVPLMEEVGIDYRQDETHFIEYTKDRFREELQQAGLYIIHLEVCWGEIWAEAR